MDKWALRDYTHKNCPEWEDPGDTSLVIPYERLLKYLGKDAASERIAEEISSIRQMARYLADVQ
jgi:cell division GTPase FtsZ